MTLLPKKYRPRQGLRKSDRWGPCKECGYPASFRCLRCKSWRCRDCIRLRKTGRIGVYTAGCYPRCRKRMNPAVAKRVKAFEEGTPP